MTDNKNNPATSPPAGARADAPEQTNLSRRYGDIGIEAVAAAVKYAGALKDPPHRPEAPRIDQRFVEAGA